MRSRLALSTLAILPILGMTSHAAGQMGVINYAYVNIRVNPGADKAVGFVLKKGDKVEILSSKDGWMNIKSENRTGWVQKDAVKTVSSDFEKKSSDSAAKDMVVDSQILNFRNKPSTGSEVVAVLSKGDKVIVHDTNAGWSKVTFNGQTGYVSSRFLSEDKSSVENEAKHAEVISESLSMRNSTDIKSGTVHELKKGDVVSVLSNSDGWTKVGFNGKEGYVSSLYLRTVENTQVQKDESQDKVDPVQTEPVQNDPVNVPAKATGKVEYMNMGMSLDDHINLQLSKALNVDSAKGKKADKNDLKYYMNPENFKDEAGMMQFAKLDVYTDDVTVDQLNAYLNKYCKPGSVFYNQGKAFIDAARKNNINVLYLTAHSMIETGYGNSQLARGVKCNGKTVYNFFGIGAVDGNALKGGAQTAYKNGWTSVAAGIDGAAKWISDRYLHSIKYNQNTLYQMKWSNDFMWHQYASDIKWPSEIGKKMGEIGTYSTNLSMMDYIVPQYN